MLPPKRLGRFIIVSVAAYAVLMAPWPGLQRGYAYLFRSGGDIVFARFWFWPDGGVRFLNLKSLKSGDLAPGAPKIEAVGTFDTLMELRSRGASGVGYLRTSSRYVGYGPTVIVIALVLATPIRWSRRGWALLWGMVWIHAFILLRLTLTLMAGGFAADKKYALFHPSPFWTGVLTRAESLLSDNPTVSFVVPTFIWFLVALRRSLWAAPRRRTSSDSSSD